MAFTALRPGGLLLASQAMAGADSSKPRVRVVSRSGDARGFHTPRTGCASAREAADAEPVSAGQQVGGVGVDPVGPGSL